MDNFVNVEMKSGTLKTREFLHGSVSVDRL
jgi:hypothetical protein